jgi:hypothetical protein
MRPARAGSATIRAAPPLPPDIHSEPTGARAATTPGQHHAGLRVIAIHEIIKTSCLLLVARAALH